MDENKNDNKRINKEELLKNVDINSIKLENNTIMGPLGNLTNKINPNFMNKNLLKNDGFIKPIGKMP